MKYTNEIVLLDDVTISGAGAQAAKALMPQWAINPRMVCLISSVVQTGTPDIEIKVQHSLDATNWFDLYQSFTAAEATELPAYTEDLTTRFPFAFMRANVVKMTNVTTMEVRLVAQMDRSM